MDGFPEYKLLQKRVDAAEREISAMRVDLMSLQKDSRGFRSDLDRLVFLVIGDEELGLVGIVERIKHIEALLSDRTPGRWLGIGVAFSGLVGLVTLVLILTRFV